MVKLSLYFFESAPFLIGDRDELARETRRQDTGGDCTHPIGNVDQQLRCSTTNPTANSNRGR